MSTIRCAICGGETEPSVVATERMMGVGGEFCYDECRECGCVQLRNVPVSMGPYYSSGYYAFVAPEAPSALRAIYRTVRDGLLFGRARIARALVATILPRLVMEPGEWLARAGVGRESRILDVGCGFGALLRRLVDAGYRDVSGLDPFVSADLEYRGRLLVRRATLDQAHGSYDLIMFHHSFEHIEEQKKTMLSVARLLSPGGTCLIRVPTVSSSAWEEYKDRWVQLDAPRHLFLHSRASMERLATSAGLRVDQVVYDSTRFQFEGSELYRRDIPLREMAEHPISPLQRLRYSARARRLNARQQGDQAAFYLRKA